MSSLDRWNYYIHYFVHKHIKNAKLNNSATNQIIFFPCREVHSSPFSRKNEKQINKRDRQKKHLFVFCWQQGWGYKYSRAPLPATVSNKYHCLSPFYTINRCFDLGVFYFHLLSVMRHELVIHSSSLNTRDNFWQRKRETSHHPCTGRKGETESDRERRKKTNR